MALQRFGKGVAHMIRPAGGRYEESDSMPVWFGDRRTGRRRRGEEGAGAREGNSRDGSVTGAGPVDGQTRLGCSRLMEAAGDRRNPRSIFLEDASCPFVLFVVYEREIQAGSLLHAQRPQRPSIGHHLTCHDVGIHDHRCVARRSHFDVMPSRWKRQPRR